MRSTSLPSLLAALCLIGAPASIGPAAGPPPGHRIAPAIIADLAAGVDRFPVIVHLATSAQARTRLDPRSDDGDRLRRDAVRDIVGSELAGLAAALGPDELASVRPFLLQPAYAATLTRRGLLEVIDRPSVIAVEPDLVFTAHTAEGLEMIGAVSLHELGFTGEGTAVAIIDTGIDALHPTLGGLPLPNPKVVRGLDTADLDDDPTDCGGHGTAVASIAAGTSYQWSPQLRFAGGVAPQAKILAYKASPDADCGSFQLSAVVVAIEDALLHRLGDGYQLAAINLSFGAGAFEGPCDGFASSYANAAAAAAEAGVTVVASSGNEGLTDAIAAPACVGEVLSVASVWDTDSGWVGYSFCLDPECEARCDDSFRPAGAVTCYSNASPVLDLLAPSEYLRAARADGQTIEFGGTSGAAAYATGAVALVRHAAPELAPAAVRQLLQLSGDPTFDPRSGLVRPRVNLERALSAADRIHASTAPGMTIAIDPVHPTVSNLYVQQPGLIGSVRVLLQLIHPAPERLEVKLVSPSGTRVRLHDHGAGSIPGNGDAPHHDGLWGLYPDELEPADSLGELSGEPAAGSWRLEILDGGPAGPGGELARLVGWAIAIEAAEPPAAPAAATTVIIPVVAHGHGALGSMWRSDVRIFNPSPDTAATARLYFVSAAGDGTPVYRQSELVLAQDTVVSLPDVVARRFAAAAPRGTLLVQSAAAGLLATSRTFTGDWASGSYGQFIGSVHPAQVTGLGEPPLAIAEIAVDPDFRTNLGLSEVAGDSATVTVVRVDGGTGNPRGSPMTFSVPPFSNLQVPISAGPGASPVYAVVEVSAGGGRITAYASLVDNRTGDAVFVPSTRPPSVDRLMIPVVARHPGRNGTQWRSALQVVNLGPMDATLELRLRPRLDVPAPAPASAALGPGQSLSVADVVQDLFGLDQAVGSLEISVGEGTAPIVASSRTFNVTAAGSYGQAVGPVSSGVGPRAVILHVDASASLRTNLGLCEVTGSGVRVRCTLRDEHGRALGQPLSLEPGPFELIQIDDVFAAAGAPPTENARIELEQVSGTGEFTGYASVVDAVTGDAIFVPATPLAP